MHLGAAPVAGKRYRWAPAAGLSDTTIANPIARPEKTTTYTMTVYDSSFGGACAWAYDWVTLTVPQPRAYAGYIKAGWGFRNTWITRDTTLCSNQTLQLGMLENQYCNSCRYQWVPTAGLDTATRALVYAQPQQTTTYTLITIDTLAPEGCNTAWDTVRVQVVHPDFEADAGGEQHIRCGESVTLGHWSNRQDLTYRWEPAETVVDDRARFTTANPLTSTTFTMLYASEMPGTGIACFLKDSVRVTVRPAYFGLSYTWNPKIFISPPCVVNFHNTTENPDLQYVWYFPATTALLPGTDVTHSFPDYGSYTVEFRAKHRNGCRDTLTREIVLSPWSVPDISAGNDRIYCLGALPISIGGKKDNRYAYRWEPGTGLQDSLSPNPIANPGVTTTYTMVATNATMPDPYREIRDTMTVTVRTLTLPVDTLHIACRDSVFYTLESTPPADQYYWMAATGMADKGAGKAVFFPNESRGFTGSARDAYCRAETELWIEVGPMTGLGYEPQLLTTEAPYRVILKNKATPSSDFKFYWYYGSWDIPEVTVDLEFDMQTAGSFKLRYVAIHLATGCKYELTQTLNISSEGITVTSIENPEKMDVQIYPNPAQDRVHLAFPATIREIRCTDMIGRVLEEIALPVGSQSWDISTEDWVPGIYLLQLMDSYGAIHTQKLVIER